LRSLDEHRAGFSGDGTIIDASRPDEYRRISRTGAVSGTVTCHFPDGEPGDDEVHISGDG